MLLSVTSNFECSDQRRNQDSKTNKHTARWHSPLSPWTACGWPDSPSFDVVSESFVAYALELYVCTDALPRSLLLLLFGCCPCHHLPSHASALSVITCHETRSLMPRWSLVRLCVRSQSKPPARKSYTLTYCTVLVSKSCSWHWIAVLSLFCGS